MNSKVIIAAVLAATAISSVSYAANKGTEDMAFAINMASSRCGLSGNSGINAMARCLNSDALVDYETDSEGNQTVVKDWRPEINPVLKSDSAATKAYLLQVAPEYLNKVGTPADIEDIVWNLSRTGFSSENTVISGTNASGWDYWTPETAKENTGTQNLSDAAFLALVQSEIANGATVNSFKDAAALIAKHFATDTFVSAANGDTKALQDLSVVYKKLFNTYATDADRKQIDNSTPVVTTLEEGGDDSTQISQDEGNVSEETEKKVIEQIDALIAKWKCSASSFKEAVACAAVDYCSATGDVSANCVTPSAALALANETKDDNFYGFVAEKYPNLFSKYATEEEKNAKGQQKVDADAVKAAITVYNQTIASYQGSENDKTGRETKETDGKNSGTDDKKETGSQEANTEGAKNTGTTEDRNGSSMPSATTAAATAAALAAAAAAYKMTTGKKEEDDIEESDGTTSNGYTGNEQIDLSSMSEAAQANAAQALASLMGLSGGTSSSSGAMSSGKEPFKSNFLEDESEGQEETDGKTQEGGNEQGKPKSEKPPKKVKGDMSNDQMNAVRKSVEQAMRKNTK